MKIGPFTIDVDALAAGILAIIEEHPHGGCLALGMLPADVMAALEAGLEEKIPDCFHDSAAENIDDRIRTDGAEMRRKISHEVTVSILRQASEQGKCVV